MIITESIPKEKFAQFHEILCKTGGRYAPMGMFETAEIDNDLAMVDAAICDYYEINSKETN